MKTQLFFVSADPIDKAKIFAEELNLKSKIGYGLTIEQMRKLGLYRSEPRPNEVDYIFPEPGLFLINPKGKIHIIELSNAPFIRPDIDLILRGINHIQKNNYPIRGTH
jgi:peroxiredoxin